MWIRALVGCLMLGAAPLVGACGGETEEEPATDRPAAEEAPPPEEPRPSPEDHEAMGHTQPDPEPQPAGDGHTDHQH